jgi:hypothetical protein
MPSAAPRRALLAFAGSILLVAADDPNPDASLWIEELHVGLFGRSGSIGGGRLRYRGEVRPFSIEGLSATGSGITSLRAQGEVFDLRRPEGFSGTYRETSQPGGRAEGSVDVHWLRNQAGVRIRLRSSRAGVALRIGEGGLTLALDG